MTSLLLLIMLLQAEPAELQPQTDIVITGVVRDHAGQPIANANIFLAFVTESLDEHRPMPETTSDSKGKFSLSVKRDLLMAGECTVLAIKDGFGFGCADQHIGTTHWSAAITLQPSAKMNVKIMGPGGDPLPNARVRFHGYYFAKVSIMFTPVADRFERNCSRAGVWLIFGPSIGS